MIIPVYTNEKNNNIIKYRNDDELLI